MAINVNLLENLDKPALIKLVSLLAYHQENYIVMCEPTAHPKKISLIRAVRSIGLASVEASIIGLKETKDFVEGAGFISLTPHEYTILNAFYDLLPSEKLIILYGPSAQEATIPVRYESTPF